MVDCQYCAGGGAVGTLVVRGNSLEFATVRLEQVQGGKVPRSWGSSPEDQNRGLRMTVADESKLSRSSGPAPSVAQSSVSNYPCPSCLRSAQGLPATRGLRPAPFQPQTAELAQGVGWCVCGGGEQERRCRPWSADGGAKTGGRARTLQPLVLFARAEAFYLHECATYM